MKSTIKIITFMMLLMFSYQSYSTSRVLRNFQEFYPDSASVNRDCQLCHQVAFGDTNWNSYGTALLLANSDFASIEGLDSDGDGLTNLEEIENDLDPGLVKTFENTYTFRDGTTLENQAPTVFDTDGGFGDEETCFPVITETDTEASFYCTIP